MDFDIVWNLFRLILRLGQGTLEKTLLPRNKVSEDPLALGYNINLSPDTSLRSEASMVNMAAGSSTRIGVKRIVIEVNRDLSVEQLEILDNALKQVGLVKTTKVMFHHAPRVHKPRPAKPTTHHVFRIGHETGQGSPVSH